ncbi:MAG: protoporphyrinogen oxidase [Gemmatimonadetes bacterium]|nr:protoporphyrinogen oxidase [Gemmatimonadota bacterium]
MASIAVIGAGVAGLTAAVELKRAGHAVTVFEADDRAGGVIQSVRHGGFLADFGANSMLAPPPLVRGLLSSLDLKRHRVDASTAASRRYVVRGGRPLAVPTSPLALVTTPLFSVGAKLRMLTEAFNRSRPAGGEESVASLVERRLGAEIVQYALDPIVAGVYAGNPHRLSAMHAMPLLGGLEARYGSFVKGALGLIQERRRDRARGVLPPEPEGKMFSYRDGMATLPLALAKALDHDIHYRTRVTRLGPVGSGWRVVTLGPEGPAQHLVDAVICAAPAHGLARIEFAGKQGEDWSALPGIEYSPVAVVVSGYKREEVRHALDGFGVLVPEREGRQTLGTLFSSSLFAERAPAGYVTLTTFVGGARQPDLALSQDATVEAAVDRDLAHLLGITGTPTFRLVQRHTRAIPQYNVGYGAVKERMDRLERTNPGLFLTGSYRNGVSVGDVMTSGLLAAQAVGENLPAGDVAPSGATG